MDLVRDETCLFPALVKAAEISARDEQYFPLLHLVEEFAAISPDLAHDELIDVVSV